jgi:hypothetical protein
MKSLPIAYLPLFLALMIIIGCSSNGGNPTEIVAPASPPELAAQTSVDGQSILGIYSIDVDIATGDVNVIRNRSAEKHWDVTPLLIPPGCPDCFQVAIISISPTEKLVDLRVTLKNPSNLTGFDVRGIILDFGSMTLLNPDAYTKLFGPGDINPFIAWITNPERTFSGFQIQFEEISIHVPSYPSFPPFSFVVSASWPGHAQDPYDVKPFEISEDLESDGSNSVTVNCSVKDWQNNIESVTIDLTPLGGSFGVPMTDAGGGFYQKEISYIAGPGEGYYDLLITATTSGDIANKNTYNYATVHVVGPGTEYEIEFDDEERISFTSGQSFIWPKHALAIDSFGNAHAVWADNDPDPMSHTFKLFYAKRTSGGWQTAQVVGSADVDAVYGTICIDETGDIHIVWEDMRAGELRSDIYYTNSDSGFLTEVKLTDADPQVRFAFPRCVARGGLIHIVWYDNRNDITGEDWDVWYMTYNPSTGLVADEIAVAATAGVYEGYPSIDIDVQGNVHVAFQQLASWMVIYHKEKAGLQFGDLHLVADDRAYQPTIHCGNHPDYVFVGYHDYSDGSFSDAYVGVSQNGGLSYDKLTVSTSSTEYQVHPDVIQAINNDLYVVWAEEGYIDEDGTPGPDDLNGDLQIDQDDAVPHRVYFRQLLGMDWEPTITLVGEDDAGAFPQIAVGLDKRVHVSYMKWTEEEPYNNYELYYRRSTPPGD